MSQRTTPRGRPGSLICTAARPELFRALFLTARELNPDGLLLLTQCGEEPLLTSGVLEADASPWWQSQDAVDILALLEDVLHDVAPPGHYFGQRVGADCDHGYWPITDKDHPNPRWCGATRNPDWKPE
jgi:hypothetical protein